MCFPFDGPFRGLSAPPFHNSLNARWDPKFRQEQLSYYLEPEPSQKFHKIPRKSGSNRLIQGDRQKLPESLGCESPFFAPHSPEKGFGQMLNLIEGKKPKLPWSSFECTNLETVPVYPQRLSKKQVSVLNKKRRQLMADTMRLVTVVEVCSEIVMCDLPLRSDEGDTEVLLPFRGICCHAIVHTGWRCVELNKSRTRCSSWRPVGKASVPIRRASPGSSGDPERPFVSRRSWRRIKDTRSRMWYGQLHFCYQIASRLPVLGARSVGTDAVRGRETAKRGEPSARQCRKNRVPR